MLSPKQTDGQYHPVAYASLSLTVHECNYHSIKQEFLAVKWAIAEQFQEYLLWKPFIVRTNNNPLTYIMTTPNLDVTQHHWVESLTWFTFSIKYQKGWGNAAVDALGQVTLKLDVETVKSILDGVTVRLTGRADTHNPVVAEADEEIHKQVQETAVQARTAHMHVGLYVMDWVAAQLEDSILWTMIKWISNQKYNILISSGRWCKDWRGNGHSSRVEKTGGLTRSPLPSPYTSWWTGRCFLVHGPHSSLSGCYEWMSPRCWTPGSAPNSLFTTGLVLVVWHGYTDAESN